jgi:hypothetical protein
MRSDRGSSSLQVGQSRRTALPLTGVVQPSGAAHRMGMVALRFVISVTRRARAMTPQTAQCARIPPRSRGYGRRAVGGLASRAKTRARSRPPPPLCWPLPRLLRGPAPGHTPPPSSMKGHGTLDLQLQRHPGRLRRPPGRDRPRRDARLLHPPHGRERGHAGGQAEVRGVVEAQGLPVDQQPPHGPRSVRRRAEARGRDPGPACCSGAASSRPSSTGSL